MKRVIWFGIYLLFLSVVGASSLQAQWVQDGAAICTAAGDQAWSNIVSDGAGGVIMAWRDSRSGNWDIYAQRVNASGVVQWDVNGVALCSASGDQYDVRITSDGVGGAIVTWLDPRNGDNDIYAQRVNASGVVQWDLDGVALCAASREQNSEKIVSDGAGGAIAVWSDYRNGSTADIYAQRVNAFGVVQWGVNGVALCTASGHQCCPEIVSDGAGGAIVAWNDPRSGNNDIYAQRVNASGVAQWIANGVALCTVPGYQSLPVITSDGAGGAIVAWNGWRDGGGSDIYAQRMSASGVVQWVANGVALCTATGDQWPPAIMADGAGGAIVTWYDYRGVKADIYAQRVNVSGEVQWDLNGVVLCAGTAGGAPNQLRIVSDGAGGAIVPWYDIRGGYTSDIYAQRVDASGFVRWVANGVALCTATKLPIGDWYWPVVTSDGAGGAIVAWHDRRSGNYDIYAQRVDSNGRTGRLLAPHIFSVRDVPGDQGGKVYASWYASSLDVSMDSVMSRYTVWRAINASRVAAVREAGGLLVSSVAELVSTTSAPVIRVDEVSGTSYFWELVGSVDAYHLDGYGLTVNTLFDSTSVCKEKHYFQVIAHTTDPTVFYVSDADSGYSVDNLAPDPPSRVSGRCVTGVGLLLTWAPNSEEDLSHYAIYKGLDSTFVPDEASLIGIATDTTFVDGSYNPSVSVYYKLIALDVHENQSRWMMWAKEGGPTVVYTPELAARVGEQGIEITWDALPGATGYDLYERTETEEAYTRITETSILPGLPTYVYELSEYPEVTTYIMLSVLVPGGIEVRYGPVVVYPLRTAIVRCSPNPFSQSTQVQYSAASDMVGSLRVYDVTGRLVRTLHEGIFARGTRSIVWDGSTDAGQRAAAGIYLLRLETERFVDSRKLVLTRQ